MEKNRVSIACINKSNSEIIKEQLDNLLGDLIDFECIDCNEEMDLVLGSNLILASGNRAANVVSNILMDNTDMLIIRRTIKKENFEKLINIPDDAKILVVNDDLEMSEATISLLYELGLKNNELVPYYPECDYQKGVYELAITPNEIKHVPYDIKRIIDIGTRVIDSSTIFDILYKLDLLNKNTIKIVIDYMNTTIPLNPSLRYLLIYMLYMSDSKVDFGQVLNIIDYGIMIYDNNERIVYYNKEIQRIFNISPYYFINNSLTDINELIGDVKLSDNSKDYFVHKFKGHTFIISNYKFNRGQGLEQGGMITLIDYESVDKLVFTFNNHKSSETHMAKYTFDDIVGNSNSIKKTIQLAKNFSKFDSPILIQGESGTGKELFAQSIHNSSKRKDGPFVAFNCAALSDSLLESELFGYDKGAFTGAKKEGKVGLFELANGGSIFLDEIGDVSINFQAKLLRVIQEGELMRVGGTEVIPIDVRIISATNKDLNKLVDEGKFREDLYYRINVLPLYIEPFRNRKEDIKNLIDFLYKKNKLNKDISKVAMEILLDYDWPGNGREIENCVEYLSTINKNRIDKEDIPRYIFEKMKRKSLENDTGKNVVYESWVYVLMILKEAKVKGKKVGRKTITEELNNKSIYITEGEVRNILNFLMEKGLAISSRGRGGTKITNKGWILLEEEFKIID